MTIPTILNILLTTYVMSKIFKVKDSEVRIGLIPEEVLKNKRDAILAGLGIVITIALLIINDILELFGAPHIKYRGVIPFVDTVSATVINFWKSLPVAGLPSSSRAYYCKDVPRVYLSLVWCINAVQHEPRIPKNFR